MKIYCISDIHGHWDNFKRFIDTLEKDDVVYVLGDVIDKGAEPIKCLKYIMNDPRFTMILGNHEYMMYQYLSTEIPYEQEELYVQWVMCNSGRDTLVEYRKLDEKDQDEILNFIKDLPLNIPNLKVGDRTYYLVHSNPHSYEKLRMEDVGFDDDVIVSYVWDRVNPMDRIAVKDQIVVAGHTFVQEYLGYYDIEVKPVFSYKKNYGSEPDIKNTNYIDIDGGLAADLPNSKLIALCLDDLTFKVY